jgi:hypothetical protein
MTNAVQHTTELARVLSLPRRDWHEGADALAANLTDVLRTGRACAGCGGQREHVRGCDRRRIPLALYGHQAVYLFNLYQYQGAVGPMGVGKGKTLGHLLSARVLGSMRPMLVLPGGLIGKTRRDWLELAVYWQIPNWLKLVSYEVLGRVSGKEELERYRPDFLGFDEVHKLKNQKAAVTRRVVMFVDHHRYHDKRKRTCRLCEEGIPPRALVSAGNRNKLRVSGLSGTITSKGLKDFAHILHMCIPELYPLPNNWHELEQWRLAVDEGVSELSRVEPGALLVLATDEDKKQPAFNPLFGCETLPDLITVARRGIARRLRDTPGIVTTLEGTIGTSLQIVAREAPPSPSIEAAFQQLRHWKLPTGDECVDGVEIYRHALTESLGYFRIIVDKDGQRPPAPWRDARSIWGTFVRTTIKGGKYDSEQDVALNAHRFQVTVNDVLQWRNPERKPDKLWTHPDPVIGAMHPYDYWRSVKDSFKQDRDQGVIWICDSVLRDAASWLESHHKGIVWTNSTCFGPALSKLSGRPYFGEEGLDARGNYIENASGPIIASFDANKTGRNLQFKWCDNAFFCELSDGIDSEQSIARTHRDGQDEDTVIAELFLGCLEHATAFENARTRARYIEDTSSQPPKAELRRHRVSKRVRSRGARWSPLGQGVSSCKLTITSRYVAARTR